MELAISAGRERPATAGARRLAWWVLCWIGLANLPFAVMWWVGGPPRYPEILATGTVGLIVRKAGFPVRYFAFAALLAYAVLSYVSALFNLSILSLAASVRFLVELRPAASIEYVAVAGLIAATLAAAWPALRRPTGFAAPRLLLAAAAALFAFAALDLALAGGNRGAYKRLAPAGAPFASATLESGFAGGAAGERHLVIVMVEALGLPRDPALRARLLAPWRQGGLARRYAMTHGDAPWYGSTTNAEIRELCGRWGDYPDLGEGGGGACLPARLAAAGYATTAIHSFDGSLFDRTDWYPEVGFETMLFRDDLLARGAGRCPGVFPGACDRDVPALIAARLKRAEGPQFVYWLTVNSHLPVPANAALGTAACARSDPALARAHPMTCRLFALWDEVNRSLAAMLADPDLPPTDILIVGDHAPPLFDREERALFDRARIPWILLRRKQP